MNGYFQIQIDDRGVSILLSPPIGEGEPIHVTELREYLDRLCIPYDAMAINSALYSLRDEEIVLFLSATRILPVDEMCKLIVSPDMMTVTLRLYPPSAGGRPMSKAHIMNRLADARILAGIDETAIKAFLENKEYCTDVIVARGTLPAQSRDAEIVYYFDTNNNARPEIKEDGSVDFFKLNQLHHCTEGQVLAEIVPEEKGGEGVDVYGRTIPSRDVNKINFSYGKNMKVSEDGLKLISLVDGHVSLVDGMVFVSNVYSVEDVSTSTGNIEYHGNVEVKGNVCENFSVKTDGDVFVKGVVEGASIEAGGNIIIARGMHGQNKGSLKAGGNIVAKFISAAEVSSGGYVEAEQILNAKVSAGTCVNAEAGKGLITGGKVVAKSAVNVKNAGSPMGTSTIIEVGSDPEMKKRLTELQKSVGEKSKAISQMKKVIEDTAKKVKEGKKLAPDQLNNAKMLQINLSEAQSGIQKELREIEQLDKILKGEDNAHIDVRGTMYQGVAVSISGATMMVKNEYTFCRLIKKGADIISTNL